MRIFSPVEGDARGKEIQRLLDEVKKYGYTRSPFTKGETAFTKPFVRWFNRKLGKNIDLSKDEDWAAAEYGEGLDCFWGKLHIDEKGDHHRSYKTFPQIQVHVKYGKAKHWAIPYINKATNSIHYRPTRRPGILSGFQKEFDGYWTKPKKGDTVPIKLGWALYHSYQGQKNVGVTQYADGQEVEFTVLDIPVLKDTKSFCRWWRD